MTVDDAPSLKDADGPQRGTSIVFTPLYGVYGTASVSVSTLTLL